MTQTPSNPPVPSKARERQVARTPGPWTVAEYTTINSGDRPILCDRKEWPAVASAVLASTTERCGKRLKEERDANARLIAAAPDLLAACEALVASDKNGRFGSPDFPAAIKQARAAIALATLGAKTP